MSSHIERESLLTQLTSAFARKDNAQILKAMRADVAIEVPGESLLAGSHHGSAAVDRFLSGLRQVFSAEGAPSEYHHSGNEMVLTQILRARGALWEHHYRSSSTRMAGSSESSSSQTTSRGSTGS